MRLHSYVTRAEHVCNWPSFRDDALVYGIELEMEPRSHSSQLALLRALGEDCRSFFCKSDGSLSSGVELVTVPMSLAEHRGERVNWRETLRPVLPIAMAGARTTACGMHVHINRRALSPLTLGKILLFVNAPECSQLITTLAQRTPNTYCRTERKKWADAKAWRGANRYQAVNVTGNTVEFRFFRGTIRHDRVLKNLEACDAIVHFARATPASRIIDPAGFVAYVVRNAREWPVLAAYLAEVGMGPAAVAGA